MGRRWNSNGVQSSDVTGFSQKQSRAVGVLELQSLAFQHSVLIWPADTNRTSRSYNARRTHLVLQPFMPEIAMPGSRSSTAKGDDSFALSPPPTRRRLFIQMLTRPKECGDAAGVRPGQQSTNARSKQVFGQPKSASRGQGKRVQRRDSTKKTAHRLLEKRRRNKTNETFALLKSLIPACAGNVHKLAILQVVSLHALVLL